MVFRRLRASEIERALFDHFERRQVVTDCFRKENGQWVIKPAPFIDQWNEEEYLFLVECLKQTIRTGGVVYGAFSDRKLKGFASVEKEPFGSRNQYLDLTSLHVSEDMRGCGIGRTLFCLACGWAAGNGAEKLYISSHSAVETQRFYEAMGCVDAEETQEDHVMREPYDRQLEKELNREEE